jgi:hypothetical protein
MIVVVIESEHEKRSRCEEHPTKQRGGTYTHHTIRGILHLGLVELHLLLMEHGLDLRIFPSYYLK